MRYAIPLVLLAGTFTFAQEPATRPWTLTESQVRAVVGRVRAGRDLTPKSWPNGARVAVGLSFDLDNETGPLRDGSDSPALFAQGEYGSRAGLPRILALLERHGIPASFFVPAVSGLLHPDSIQAIMRSGQHEIGLHGCLVLCAGGQRTAPSRLDPGHHAERAARDRTSRLDSRT
jgi:hypothetical protein